MSIAYAKALMRSRSLRVLNPAASNSVNPALLHELDRASSGEAVDSTLFFVASTSKLVYNASPAKLTAVSVLSAAMSIARRELEEHAVSNKMGLHTPQLKEICESVVGEASLDTVWCAWVLVVYLSAHPRGKDLLRESGITDIDLQSALAFERYGGEEIRRRARQGRAADPEQESANSALELGDDKSSARMKRERMLAKTYVPTNTADPYALLHFWHSALASDNVSVLLTLACHDKRTATEASLATLVRQASGTLVARHEVLQAVACTNAIKSSRALVNFVSRRVDDIPVVCAFTARDPRGKRPVLAVGISRTPQEGANTQLHACSIAPADLLAAETTGIRIAWSFASQRIVPQAQDQLVLPGIAERHRERFLNAQRIDNKKADPKAHRRLTMIKSFIDSNAERPVTQQASGTTRSFIALKTFVNVNQTHKAAAEALHAEAAQLVAQHGDNEGSAPATHPVLLGSSQEHRQRCEPLCTPSSPLALGISANECIRRWMMGRCRKHEPAVHPLGFICKENESSRDSCTVADSEPTPMLCVTDFGIEFDEKNFNPDSNCGNGTELPASIALHVCGDGAVRLPELLCRMAVSDAPDFAKKARAAILVASSQASFVGVVASSLASGYANTAISSSKKISVPDVTKLLLLSPYDAYVCGLCNIAPVCEDTPFHGVYGARLDLGVTPHGLFAHNLRSDRRQHGSLCLSKEAADKLTVAFAEANFVEYEAEVGKKRKRVYAHIPLAARGIPHNLTPGIHSVLDDYEAFLQSSRTLTDRELCDTVDSIHVLPFSAFSQLLRPDVESSCDASLRSCFREEMESSVATGRAFLHESTSEQRAIISEPLFRRPCQTSCADNAFATSYESAETFFNIACTLGLLCKVAWTRARARGRAGGGGADAGAGGEGECAVDFVYTAICKLVDGEELHIEDASFAADALLLVNCLYPSDVRVGFDGLDDKVARLVCTVQKQLDLGILQVSIKTHAERPARFWAAFTRASAPAWPDLGALIKLIVNHDGSHAASTETCRLFKRRIDSAVRAAWLVHSLDGVNPPPLPHPMQSARSPDCVSRAHIDPRFFSTQFHGEQRGSAVGMKPDGLRIIVVQMLGATMTDAVNYTVNEGGMALRVSSDPLIRTANGEPRTSKAISPLQTESDYLGFGSREQKIAGARLQKLAWDKNALRLKGMLTSINEPRPQSLRFRGEIGTSMLQKREREAMRADGQLESISSRSAESLIHKASMFAGIAK